MWVCVWFIVFWLLFLLLFCLFVCLLAICLRYVWFLFAFGGLFWLGWWFNLGYLAGVCLLLRTCFNDYFRLVAGLLIIWFCVFACFVVGCMLLDLWCFYCGLLWCFDLWIVIVICYFRCWVFGCFGLACIEFCCLLVCGIRVFVFVSVDDLLLVWFLNGLCFGFW